MEKVYELYQHTHCVLMHIGKTYITTDIVSTSNRDFGSTFTNEVQLDASITYNKQRTDVKYVGRNSEEKDKDDIVIGRFCDGLYKLFKKNKETWDEEDDFLMKAVSDYLVAAVELAMEKKELKIEDFDLFHYAFIVPSEWEEEIRDEIIRPIFVQSGLISNEDHQDRLLFFTDIESICYDYSFKRAQNTILCRISPEEDKIIVKFDLIQTATTLFNIPNAHLLPKVMKSSSISITTADIQGRIKDFLRAKLFPMATENNDKRGKLVKPFLISRLVSSAEEQIIKALMEEINHWPLLSLGEEGEEENEEEEEDEGEEDENEEEYDEELYDEEEYDEVVYDEEEYEEEEYDEEEYDEEEYDEEEYYEEEELCITIEKECMLGESQKEFINSLCPSIICAEIGIFLLGYMKNIISSSSTKSYRFLLVTDNYSDCNYRPKNDIKWIKRILEYNRCSLSSIVTRISPRKASIDPAVILKGAGKGVFEAIQHSDMYCKPRIVSPVDLVTSSSVFLNSKPDAIINLDISLGSTLLTCSILDEDGSTRQIFDHNYCIGDRHLPPLGHFYKFSNTTTLIVKKQFILFAEIYLLDYSRVFTATDDAFIKNNLLFEMKTLLTRDLSNKKILVSTDKQKYIKAFILMYMIYLKEEILEKLPFQLVSDQRDIKIGYAVSIEEMLLNKTMESKDNLRDIIYASGLVPKDHHSKKLRINTQGERILPAIQRSLELELSLKSYFLLCQLHEDYVQLSLHQVVTASSSEEKEQESIIVQDEIIPIQNIYDSLCSNMWRNLLQDNSLIELCELHYRRDNKNILNRFSPNVKTAFDDNLKRHISDNVLQNNSLTKITDGVNLTSSCNCKVRLTISDIINISFTPVLQDIACTLYASLLNKELFGNYINIDYLFTFIRFNNNPQLQYAFTRILEQEADDFNLEMGIDTSCMVVPELFNQLLRPVIAQRPHCYKDFIIGALQQVCSENYVASIALDEFGDAHPMYKSKITSTKTIECAYDVAFPFLNKDRIKNNVLSSRRFYLRNQQDNVFYYFKLVLYRFKTMNYLENNEALSLDDNIYQRVGAARIYFDGVFEQKDVDVPVIVSISYVSYTSSLKFSVKIVGANPKDTKLAAEIETGEPLTLIRL